MRRMFRVKNEYKWVKTCFIIFAIFLIVGIAFTLFMESFLRPIFLAVAEEKAIAKVTEAISQAVVEHSEQLHYSDLIYYQTNQQGDIILMQPNLRVVNKFTSEVTLSIQENMGLLQEEAIRIPVAQALGFQVLASLGPRVTVHMIPMGVVKPPQIVDSFESAGINQTRHKIYLRVLAEVQILVPFVNKRLQVESQVPVTEVTIIGKVPQVNMSIDSGRMQQFFGGDN